MSVTVNLEMFYCKRVLTKSNTKLGKEFNNERQSAAVLVRANSIWWQRQFHAIWRPVLGATVMYLLCGTVLDMTVTQQQETFKLLVTGLADTALFVCCCFTS